MTLWISDAFKTKKEAEAAAAKNACEKLQVFQNMAKRTSPPKSINGKPFIAFDFAVQVLEFNIF